MNRRTRLQVRPNSILQGVPVVPLSDYLAGFFAYVAKDSRAA
jgi:uncharacterized membrane-anchored protein